MPTTANDTADRRHIRRRSTSPLSPPSAILVDNTAAASTTAITLS